MSTHNPCFVPARLLAAAACGLLALAGCSAPGGEGAPPDAPRTVELTGRLALVLTVPPGYTVSTERSPLFEVHHVWREPPPPLEHEATLSIYVGRYPVAYCPGAEPGSPARFGPWRTRWRRCGTSAPGVRAREALLLEGPPHALRVFVVGSGAAELDALQAIAGTLRPAGR